jgi:hypothetical protein
MNLDDGFILKYQRVSCVKLTREAVSLDLSRPIGDGRTRLDLVARAARTLGLQSDGPDLMHPAIRLVPFIARSTVPLHSLSPVRPSTIRPSILESTVKLYMPPDLILTGHHQIHGSGAVFLLWMPAYQGAATPSTSGTQTQTALHGGTSKVAADLH